MGIYAPPPTTPPPPDMPIRPIPLPRVQLSINDFVTNFDLLKREMDRLQNLRVPSVGRLNQFVDNAQKVITNSIENMNKQLSNQILNARGATSAQQMGWITKLLTAYSKARTDIDKAWTDKGAAITTSLTDLDVTKTLTDVNTSLAKLADEQRKTAATLAVIPDDFAVDLNSNYAPFEKAMTEIKNEIAMLKR